MSYPPLTQRFLETVDLRPNPRAQLHKMGNQWQAISSVEMLRRVAGLARALAELGVATGDRMGLFSANRPEWHIADFAVLGLGAADVPVYFNESPERIATILNDSGARVVIVVGEEQARRLLGCRGQLSTVEHIVVAGAPAGLDGDTLRYETLIAGAGDDAVVEYRRRAALVTSEQLATVIYTSGTTGTPKGVELTHANLSSNEIDSFCISDYYQSDVALSFLPLSHVYERVMDYGYLFRGITVAYVEKMEQVVQAMLEVRPTVAAAVPRLFEKAYGNIQEKAAQLAGARRRIFQWALGVAREKLEWLGEESLAPLKLKLQWALADRLVFARIRAGMGGRIRAFVSGAAPLSRELLNFFWSIGVPIYQGYGLTETSPVVSSNGPSSNRLGTVGKPIPNVEVRIAEDGEILVRGPNVMRGYHGMPEETRAVLAADGWLHTGDVGHLDADGFLWVTDRKKDLIKTAAGKFVAPQPIENALKASPMIQNAIVIGDRRRFVVALLVPNFANVEARAREEGIENRSRAELLRQPKVREWMAAEVEKVNAHLAQYETVKRFAILNQDFSFDSGELTYTLKLKRRVIEEKCGGLIEALYSEAEPSPLAKGVR